MWCVTATQTAVFLSILRGSLSNSEKYLVCTKAYSEDLIFDPKLKIKFLIDITASNRDLKSFHQNWSGSPHFTLPSEIF